MNSTNHFEKHSRVESQLIYGDTASVDDPFLSICVPTYKRANLLKETIDSVLNQEGTNIAFEIVCVDNDSEGTADDKTETLIRSYIDHRLFYYRNDENIGMYGNWNRMIELARGEWIIMLHDDDYLLPGALVEIVRRIRLVDADIISHDPKMKDERSNPTLNSDVEPQECRFQLVDKWRCYRGCAVRPAAATMRRKCVLDLGGFDESYYPSSDFEFWTRACLAGAKIVEFTGSYVAIYRVCENVGLQRKTMVGYAKKGNEIRTVVCNSLPTPFLRWYWKRHLKRFSIEKLRGSSKSWGLSHDIDSIFGELGLKASWMDDAIYYFHRYCATYPKALANKIRNGWADLED